MVSQAGFGIGARIEHAGEYGTIVGADDAWDWEVEFDWGARDYLDEDDMILIAPAAGAQGKLEAVEESAPSDFDTRVDAVLRTIGDLLKSKNKAYGNSALDPVRTFSKADASAGIRLRIDDKLSRLQRGTDFEDEDTVLDLMGYLVLLRIAESGS